MRLRQDLLEGALGYRAVDWDRAQLDLFAGFRLNYVYSRLDLSATRLRFSQLRALLPALRGRPASDTETWADPIIGGRLKLRLARPPFGLLPGGRRRPGFRVGFHPAGQHRPGTPVGASVIPGRRVAAPADRLPVA